MHRIHHVQRGGAVLSGGSGPQHSGCYSQKEDIRNMVLSVPMQASVSLRVQPAAQAACLLPTNCHVAP